MESGSNISVVVDCRRDGDQKVRESSQIKKSLALEMRCKKLACRLDKNKGTPIAGVPVGGLVADGVR
jgi:hypothetical protein